MRLADEDISIEEVIPDDSHLEGEHECEGCFVTVGDGVTYCSECERALERYYRELEDERKSTGY